MKALLLAAGLGTRLRPVTNIVPKCLVPINAKPLLEYWLETLQKAGIKKCLINTHYKHTQVTTFIQNSSFSSFAECIYEKELLLTAGTLLKNSNFFDNQSLMLIHADNLSFCDYKAFIEAHHKRKKGCEITMMTFTTTTPKSCGIVELDADNIVQAFHEKVENPPSNLANGAVYIIEPTVIEFLRSLNKEKIDFSTEVLPHYIGKIQTFHNDIYHCDIGTLQAYAMAQIDVKNFL